MLIDWQEYMIRINTIVPAIEFIERRYDYQCTRCANWKKIDDFGVKGTGRIYRWCIDCRCKREEERTKRKMKKEAELKENELAPQ